MVLGALELKELSSVAIAAAREAAALIADYSQREFTVEHKAGCESIATQVVTEVDELSQEIVLKHLKPTLVRFDLALLTEESPDDGSRFDKDYFWCIDPLDGTLPFTRHEPGFAVSIALVSKAGEPVIGVVCDPVEAVVYEAVQGQGVRRNGIEWKAPEFVAEPSEQCLRFYCDCSFEMHPDRAVIEAGMREVSVRLGYREVEILMGGGGVINACSVFENPPSAYFKQPKMKAGGGSIWDFAATACLFSELGRVVTNFAGDPLDLNRVDSTFMNHEGVCFASSSDLQLALREVFSDSV